jgi:hypothetical protein
MRNLFDYIIARTNYIQWYNDGSIDQYFDCYRWKGK